MVAAEVRRGLGARDASEPAGEAASADADGSSPKKGKFGPAAPQEAPWTHQKFRARGGVMMEFLTGREKMHFTHEEELISKRARQLMEIFTSCPFARKNEHGQYVLQITDTLQWDDFTAYDDYPYRCPNGQCVATQTECAHSAMKHPLCNGHGSCMGDGTCECVGGHFRTFIFSEAITVHYSRPYTYRQDPVSRERRTFPTDWEENAANTNWQKHSLQWCQAQDCRPPNVCEVPYGCFAGSPDRLFQDARVACEVDPTDHYDTSDHIPRKAKNMCALSLEDCQRGARLEAPLPCSGRGIPQVIASLTPPPTTIHPQASMKNQHPIIIKCGCWGRKVPAGSTPPSIDENDP